MAKKTTSLSAAASGTIALGGDCEGSPGKTYPSRTGMVAQAITGYAAHPRHVLDNAS